MERMKVPSAAEREADSLAEPEDGSGDDLGPMVMWAWALQNSYDTYFKVTATEIWLNGV